MSGTMHLLSRAAILLTILAGAALAADDPSIKGDLRSTIQQAMKEHVAQNSFGDRYVIYDAVAGELKRLNFAELHRGIVKKGDFYVSCADFVDVAGVKYDLDFLVGAKGDSLHVVQALVHSIDGKKRAYHLEEEDHSEAGGGGE